ncbi:MAG TPA: Lrp/AsnC family transcriptional regulator [Deltaproteobacteria bacterium]|nr:Lrp/AsnC family transcriptional regulator [Deltaproteobacteria bacterium]
MIPLDNKDKEILTLAQGDLPVKARPFDEWAKQLGMDVNDLLERLERLRREGIIRDIKAILRHRDVGFACGAMVAWAVPAKRVDSIGSRIAENDFVTHCYERPAFGHYNVFSMIHGHSIKDVEDVVAEISSSVGIEDYQVFWSVKELKKSSMKYF